MTQIKHPPVRSRNEKFAERIPSGIWQEQAVADNPYVAAVCRCHGYDLMDLIQERSFVDVLYLLFLGELPSLEQSRFLETLLIACINPGPRHPAARAAMNAGVARTNPAHLLPISLTVLSGDHHGGSEVEAAMRFLLQQQENSPTQVAESLCQDTFPPSQGEWHVAPGFGNRFGSIDCIPRQLADILRNLPTSGKNKNLAWGNDFSLALNAKGMGWLLHGVVAAALLDLGLPPRAGAGFYQLLSAPGLLAHGLELAAQPITAMPFLASERYIIGSGTKMEADILPPTV